MKCYLIRRGEDDNTVRGGWSKAALNSKGVNQSIVLAQRLVQNSNIAKIYSSDLLRARQTAEIIADEIGVQPEFHKDLREVNNGDLAGMPNSQADEKYPGLYWRTLDWNAHYPNGESPSEFYERIKNYWSKFSLSCYDFSEDIAIVTHGGVINIILPIVDGTKYSNKNQCYKISNARAVILEFDDGIWKRTVE